MLVANHTNPLMVMFHPVKVESLPAVQKWLHPDDLITENPQGETLVYLRRGLGGDFDTARQQMVNACNCYMALQGVSETEFGDKLDWVHIERVAHLYMQHTAELPHNFADVLPTIHNRPYSYMVIDDGTVTDTALIRQVSAPNLFQLLLPLDNTMLQFRDRFAQGFKAGIKRLDKALLRIEQQLDTAPGALLNSRHSPRAGENQTA